MPGEFQLEESQLKQVVRRALELDQSVRGPGSWDLPAIEALGAEIGVSPAAIRAAWVETSTTAAPLPFQGHLLDPDPILSTRMVNDDASPVMAAIQRWFRRAGFEPVRHSGESALLERRGRLRNRRLSGISQIVVEVKPVPSDDAEVFVRVATGRKHPGRRRLAHEMYETAKGWVILDGVVVLLSESITIEHGLAALPVALAAGALQGTWRARSRSRRIDAEVLIAVEGLLDIIEHRGSGAIEPASD